MSLNKSSKFSRKYWLRLGVFAVAVVTLPLMVMLIILLQHQIDVLVTPISLPLTRTPLDINLPFKDVTLTTANDFELAAWYIPGSQPHAIILIHGLNANREAMLPTTAILAEAGYHLLLIDLRGHGQSEASQISYGYREALDVRAGADYLAALPDIEKIGVIGSSMGGAAVARAAAADPRLEAVVIQSSYSSLSDAADDALDDFTIFPKWPFGPLIVALAEWRVGIEIGEVDSARDLATITPRSVLIIHSADDRLFPLYHAQKMYHAAQEPKDLWITEVSSYGDPALAHKAEYRERIVTFFEEAFAK